MRRFQALNAAVDWGGVATPPQFEEARQLGFTGSNMLDLGTWAADILGDEQPRMHARTDRRDALEALDRDMRRFVHDREHRQRAIALGFTREGRGLPTRETVRQWVRDQLSSA
jgi:hypothetical protein